MHKKNSTTKFDLKLNILKVFDAAVCVVFEDFLNMKWFI